MRRSVLVVAVLIAGVGAGVLPALASNESVTASGFSFTPKTVTVAPGDKVTWTNSSGSHNVHFEDGSFDVPADPALPGSWPSDVSKTFSSEGTFRYRCELHGDPGYESGMVGKVVVKAGGGTTTTGSPTPTGSASPSPTPGSSPTPSPTPGAGTSVARFQRARARRDHFCTRRGRTCKRPGVVIDVDLDRAGRVTGTLERRPLTRQRGFRRFGSIAPAEITGAPATLRFSTTGSGRRLTPGRYRLTLRTPGDSRVVRFRVRAS